MGWRILLFLVLAALGTLGFSMFVPPELPYGTVPLLVGSLVGGWVLLGLDGRKAGALGFYLDRAAFGETLFGVGLGVLVAGCVVAPMIGIQAKGRVMQKAMAIWHGSRPCRAAMPI